MGNLIGLGLDSTTELFAAGVVIWRLRAAGADRETRAAGLIALTFLAGAAFLLAESVHELTVDAHSGHPAAGIAMASAALVVLPVLALVKLRAGRALGSRALIADAEETILTAAAAALLGEGLDTWIGWWWTVPAAGIAIAVIAVIASVETWRHRRAPIEQHCWAAVLRGSQLGVVTMSQNLERVPRGGATRYRWEARRTRCDAAQGR